MFVVPLILPLAPSVLWLWGVPGPSTKGQRMSKRDHVSAVAATSSETSHRHPPSVVSLPFVEHQPRRRLQHTVIALFTGSASEGTLRPHTAPERLGPGQRAHRHDDDGAPRTRGGTGQGGVIDRNYSSSTGERFGTWAGGGVKPWRREGGERNASTGGLENNGIFADKAVPKRHEFLRRPSPADKTGACNRAAGRRGDGSLLLRARHTSGTTGNRTGSGGCIRGGVTSSSADSECCPRTQILGMNAGRLPREVRQAPLDRPLTAPCGKVGRRRVRTRGGSRAGPARP